MDPLTLTVTALSCVKLVHDLGQGIVALRATIQGIKGIDDLIAGFTGELDALQLSLTILDYEIHASKGALPAAVAKWWRDANLENILENALQTFDRLNLIFADISRDRRLWGSSRQYISSKVYDDEMRHLRHRLGTYVSCLNLPVILLAILRQQPTAPSTPDFRLDLLSGKVSALDASIADLKASFSEFRATATAGSEVSEFRAPAFSPAKTGTASRTDPAAATMDETARLINMAESISFGVSTTASRLSAVASLAGDRLTHIIDEDLMSFFEGTLPGRANRRVLSWIGENSERAAPFEVLSETTPPNGPPSVISTAADPADVWTTRDGSTTAESLSTLRSNNLSPRQNQFREMTPHQEFLMRKLSRASKLFHENEMTRAISHLQGLLDHLAKSAPPGGEAQLEDDIHDLYARALLESDLPNDEIDEALAKYPGINAKAVYLSIVTARRLMAEGRHGEATAHVIQAKTSLARAGGDYTQQILARLRTEPKAIIDSLESLKMYLDISLARCHLEKLKTVVSAAK